MADATTDTAGALALALAEKLVEVHDATGPVWQSAWGTIAGPNEPHWRLTVAGLPVAEFEAPAGAESQAKKYREWVAAALLAAQRDLLGPLADHAEDLRGTLAYRLGALEMREWAAALVEAGRELECARLAAEVRALPPGG
jgi:hypothetical protein